MLTFRDYRQPYNNLQELNLNRQSHILQHTPIVVYFKHFFYLWLNLLRHPNIENVSILEIIGK
jgi:hypothetical protein